MAVVSADVQNVIDELDSPHEDEGLDDLDIFMRDNTPLKYDNSDYVFGRRCYENSSSRYDWGNSICGQSFDDFLEEQNDYDMMDDF